MGKKAEERESDDQRILIEGLLDEVKGLVNSDPQHAFSLAQQALKYSEEYGGKDLLGFSHARLSQSLLRLGEVDEGELHAKVALALGIETKNFIVHCIALHNLALV